MTAPMLLLIFAMVGALRLSKLYLNTLMALAIVVNGLLLTTATVRAWGTRFTGDRHLANVVQYLGQQKYPYAYASMDTAIPSTYYYSPRTYILSLSCSNGVLAKSYLFYDRDVFLKAEASTAQQVPIILDGDNIRNYPSLCSKDDIIKQLGTPSAIESTGYGDEVLLYNRLLLKPPL